ncbi:MAG TPA: Flp family type IVb pilin [Gemmataceae bacterium]|jgi:pilus assembly protein Flp/PilA|nr:Flp family type IVb pilin [Gemmataceae bacterium]
MSRHLTRSILCFLKSDEGPTAVEYAVMLALIVAVCIVAINTIGNNIDETAEQVSSALP